ncbi:MAG: hypothetical protein AB1454_08190 [Candidatus Auribacterota bacterium]|jgi:hypothetical protein|uniref:DUF5666 domain-containing protein n=1 Tax=Candidatus Auribacter fodinae TaxID=2093366 RepID=A0A3A4RCB1_9BACT|nr:MAG: hypothetical protein C4541_05030 [Candidatus Auribacter fodinae]
MEGSLMKKALSITVLISIFFANAALYSYMTGTKGTVDSIKKSDYRLTVKYVTNNRQNIFSYATYYADDNTIVYKNGRATDFNSLSRGDIIEVRLSGSSTVAVITVLESW